MKDKYSLTDLKEGGNERMNKGQESNGISKRNKEEVKKKKLKEGGIKIGNNSSVVELEYYHQENHFLLLFINTLACLLLLLPPLLFFSFWSHFSLNLGPLLSLINLLSLFFYQEKVSPSSHSYKFHLQ